MKRTVLLAAIVILLPMLAALAQIPRTISFQGIATTAGGSLVADGAHLVTITIYDGTTNVYSESHTVNTVRGIFNVSIGSVTPIPPTLTFDRTYQVGVSIDGSLELTPRTTMTAVPYAFRALVASQAMSVAPGATGVVSSVNGLSGAVTLQGGGNTTVTQSGGQLVISSSATGTLTGLQSTDGSIAISSSTGPVPNLSLANGSVTPAKISPAGASSGNVLTFNGVSVVWSSGASALSLPYSSSTASSSTAFAIGASGSGRAGLFEVTSATNSNSALEATTNGTGSAILGAQNATSGGTVGIRGQVASTSSSGGPLTGVTGVMGIVTSLAAGNYSAGVRGINNGTGASGIGVVGYQGGSGWGVYGETPGGTGVVGVATGTTGSSVGVRGEIFSPSGSAVEAKYSGTGAGVALEVDNGAIRVTGTNKPAFIHTATVGNKLSTNGTDIDHPLCNGDPNAILIVTQRVNPTGNIYNPSPIGVSYNTTRNRWEIVNEITTLAIPTNAQFNVLVIKQ